MAVRKDGVTKTTSVFLRRAKFREDTRKACRGVGERGGEVTLGKVKILLVNTRRSGQRRQSPQMTPSGSGAAVNQRAHGLERA